MIALHDNDTRTQSRKAQPMGQEGMLRLHEALLSMFSSLGTDVKHSDTPMDSSAYQLTSP